MLFNRQGQQQLGAEPTMEHEDGLCPGVSFGHIYLGATPILLLSCTPSTQSDQAIIPLGSSKVSKSSHLWGCLSRSCHPYSRPE